MRLQGGPRLQPGHAAGRARIHARQARHGELEIDGGVSPANIAEVARAGVDTFVAGSAVFGKRNEADPNRYDSIIAQMRAELAKV